MGSEINYVKVGERVGIPWLHNACGVCEFCLTGWETLCQTPTFTGFNVDGCMREYAVAKGKYAIKLPPDLPFEQAARKVYINALTILSRKVIPFDISYVQRSCVPE